MRSPQTPTEAQDLLRDAFTPVGSEVVALADAAGRVLAAEVATDRPSPACDVSAMDGFAVRLADLAAGLLPVAGVSLPGRLPPLLPARSAVRIMTGAPVPEGADAVIPFEHTADHRPYASEPGSPGGGAAQGHVATGAHAAGVMPAVALRQGLTSQPGQFIRRRGENAPGGRVVLSAGAVLSPAAISAAATVGATSLTVRRRVGVATLVTGDEVLPPDADRPAPWQLRDANGPALRSMLASIRHVRHVSHAGLTDDLDLTAAALTAATGSADLILCTGAVSAGDHDHVPAAARAAGFEPLFHRLPIRPGRPLFAARHPSGAALLGLPGNPLSVLATAARFALPLLRHLAGAGPASVLTVPTSGDDRTLHLWWYRPVTLSPAGPATVLPPVSSGDVLTSAASHGFVEVPPHARSEGLLAFYPWS